MALLMERVDLETIRIIGRWQSDAMLCYFHTTSNFFMDGLALPMFQYSNYAASQQSTPSASAKRHCRIKSCPPSRGCWEPGTGTVWTWRFKNRLFLHQLLVL